MPVRPQWLKQLNETILEPELAICDPHHHLWDYADSRYLEEDLLLDVSSGHNIRSTVFVECMSNYRDHGSRAMAPVGETEFVEAIAKKTQGNATQVAAAIVGFADLLLGDQVGPVLDAHISASPRRFKGIRHACSWDSSPVVRNSHTNPPPQLYLNSVFRRGFATLQEHGLLFDTWLYHTQHAELLDLARAFPNQTIILDHVGGPLGIGPYENRREEIFDEWRKGINLLASCPNILVKLGGLAMPINGFDWHKRKSPPTSKTLAAATAPYILHCIEMFGVERCMFESNFPVDKVSCSYAILWNSFKRITADFSCAEKTALYHDNAVACYDIEVMPNELT